MVHAPAERQETSSASPLICRRASSREAAAREGRSASRLGVSGGATCHHRPAVT